MGKILATFEVSIFSWCNMKRKIGSPTWLRSLMKKFLIPLSANQGWISFIGSLLFLFQFEFAISQRISSTIYLQLSFARGKFRIVFQAFSTQAAKLSQPTNTTNQKTQQTNRNNEPTNTTIQQTQQTNRHNKPTNQQTQQI